MSQTVVQVPALLAGLRAADPGRPRLTWYGADGERVELSARVLQNWVAKTANLLVDELDVGVGTPVRLELPPHWRAVVWHLAVAAAGGELVDDAAAAAVVVTVDGGAAPAAVPPPPALHVVQALPALALRARAVPPGALDAAAVVAGYGDDVPVVPGAPGLTVPGVPRVPGVREASRRRVLLDATDAAGAHAVVDAVVAALAGGCSAVLLGPGAPDAARVAAQEHAAP